MDFAELFDQKTVRVADLEASGYCNADAQSLADYADARRDAGLPTIAHWVWGEFCYLVEDGRISLDDHARHAPIAGMES